MIRRLVRYYDERLGAAHMIRRTFRYVFPDHWSFMIGEIALYAFVVLVATGIFLTFFYVPSDEHIVYQGSYEPLRGQLVGENFDSVMDISFDIPAGLLMRQTHHWAAVLFVVAIVLHLMRIILTGAFRKPREVNYAIGVTMLGLSIFEGFLGYSMVDDLLSGMGAVIAYSVALAIPVIGDDFAFLVWGGEYPGAESFWPRLEIMHVLIVPGLIAALIGVHLAQITRQHHTQFGGRGRSDRKLIGIPAWPGYALRSTSLFMATTAVLLLLGGLVQINPIWEWGPYETYLATNGAQPDWYLGWLIGGMRLMLPIEIVVGDYTVVGNSFWGGALFPVAVFIVLYAWPAIDRRLFGDSAAHNVLDRPRDNPRRTAAFLAFLTWVFTIFAAGGSDRLYFESLVTYETQLWIFRALAIVLPIVVYFVVKRVCEELRERESHPLRGWTGQLVRRTPEGGFEAVGAADGRRSKVEEPVPGAPPSVTDEQRSE